MTAGTNRFTSQEWSVVAGAPLLAAMWVLADKRGGVRATLAVARAYRDARGDYDSELLRELLATAPADATRRPHDRDALRRDAPASLRQARDIVERVGTADERAEYRRIVLALAQAAARAAGNGGHVRHGRPRETDSEHDALRSITAILDRQKEPPMQFPKTPQRPDLERDSASQPRHDEAPAGPSHANPLTRIQILTGGYIAKHPTLLTVLEGLGWNSPGGSINP